MSIWALSMRVVAHWFAMGSHGWWGEGERREVASCAVMCGDAGVIET